MDAILIATVFTLAFAGTLALLGARSGHPVAADELLQRVHGADDAGNVVVDRRGRVPESRFASALLRRVNLVRKLEQYMWQAGLYWRVSEIMLAELVLLLFGLTAGWVAWNDPLLAGACGAALFTLPLLYIGMRRKRRLKAFMAQLPYVLDMLKSTVEAGHSLQRALRMAVDEFSDPISGEFRTVLEQTRMGVPLARALEDMLIRVPEDDLRLMVTAIKMQTQVGSSLAHLVGRLSEVVRTRQRLHAQVRALTAQSRLSGMLVGLLPVFVLAIFSVVDPAVPRMLFTDPGGRILLKTAGVMDFVAILIIRKITRIHY